MGHAVPRPGLVQVSLHPRPKSQMPPRWSHTLWRKALTVPAGGKVLELPWDEAWDQYAAVTLVLSVKDPAGREARTAEELQRPSREDTREQWRQERGERDYGARCHDTPAEEHHLGGDAAGGALARAGLWPDPPRRRQRRRRPDW